MATPAGYLPSFEDRLAEFFLKLSGVAGDYGKFSQGQEQLQQTESNQYLQRLLGFNQLESLNQDRALKGQEFTQRQAEIERANRERERAAQEKAMGSDAYSQYLQSMQPQQSMQDQQIPGMPATEMGTPNLLDSTTPPFDIKALINKPGKNPLEAGIALGPKASFLPQAAQTHMLDFAAGLNKPIPGSQYGLYSQEPKPGGGFGLKELVPSAEKALSPKDQYLSDNPQFKEQAYGGTSRRPPINENLAPYVMIASKGSVTWEQINRGDVPLDILQAGIKLQNANINEQKTVGVNITNEGVAKRPLPANALQNFVNQDGTPVTSVKNLADLQDAESSGTVVRVNPRDHDRVVFANQIAPDVKRMLEAVENINTVTGAQSLSPSETIPQLVSVLIQQGKADLAKRVSYNATLLAQMEKHAITIYRIQGGTARPSDTQLNLITQQLPAAGDSLESVRAKLDLLMGNFQGLLRTYPTLQTGLEDSVDHYFKYMRPAILGRTGGAKTEPGSLAAGGSGLSPAKQSRLDYLRSKQ